MHFADTHRPSHGKRLSMLLLVLAFGVAFALLSSVAPNSASAQSEEPIVHEIAYERDQQILIMKADGER